MSNDTSSFVGPRASLTSLIKSKSEKRLREVKPYPRNSFEAEINTFNNYTANNASARKFKTLIESPKTPKVGFFGSSSSSKKETSHQKMTLSSTMPLLPDLPRMHESRSVPELKSDIASRLNTPALKLAFEGIPSLPALSSQEHSIFSKTKSQLFNSSLSNASVSQQKSEKIVTSLGVIELETNLISPLRKIQAIPQFHVQQPAETVTKDKVIPVVRPKSALKSENKSHLMEKEDIKPSVGSYELYMDRLNSMDIDMNNPEDKEFLHTYASMHQYRLNMEKIALEEEKNKIPNTQKKIKFAAVNPDDNRANLMFKRMDIFSNYIGTDEIIPAKRRVMIKSYSLPKLDLETPRQGISYAVSEKLSAIKTAPYVVIDGAPVVLRSELDYRNWLSHIFSKSELYKSPNVLYPIKLKEIEKSLQVSELEPNVPYSLVISVVLFSIFDDTHTTPINRIFLNHACTSLFRYMYRGFSAYKCVEKEAGLHEIKDMLLSDIIKVFEFV